MSDPVLETLKSVDEQDRLAVLRGYAVLDTPPEAAFDELAEAAARICNTPIAAVSLVDETRQWFKARVGLDVTETPRDVSFCDHAMWRDDLFVVPDATKDAAFAHNALVTDEPHVRFYAGAAIRSPEGVPLGALCVIGQEARPGGLSDEQAMVLRVLANQVEAQLQLRTVVAAQGRAVAHQASEIAVRNDREQRLLTALGAAAVGWWDWDVEADRVTANPDLAYIYRVSVERAIEGAPLAEFFAHVHPADRGMVQDAVAEAVETGGMFREDYRIVNADGSVTWVSARGRCLKDENGKPTTFPGVSIDITDRKLAEERMRHADMGRELALDAARLGWFDHKPDQGVRFYDARAIELMGASPEDVKSLDGILKHIHPDDREKVAVAVERVLNPSRTGLYRQTFRVPLGGGEERWVSAVGRTQFADGVCVRFMGVLEDVTSAKRAEAHRRLLANELNHRVKNTLAVIQGLVDSTLRSASEVTDARRNINARIQAFGKAHDLLTASNWSAAAVADVVEGVIATLSLPRNRLEITGGAVWLGPQPALQLALALHELATNALKYGALSNDTGRVAIAWTTVETADGARFTFEWRERGGPSVTAPTRKGFGTQLIERATAAAFVGEVVLDYEPVGLRWRLSAPYGGLPESGRAPTLVG